MSSFLLVHGSWLDARCWEPTIEQLRAAGHTAVSFDLAGHGSDEAPLDQISLRRYVDQTIEQAEKLGGGVTLVGHSMAGIVLSSAAEARPDLFSKLVYVAAYLPVDGESLNDLAQSDSDSQIGPNMRPAPDWSTLDIEESAREGLFFHDVDGAYSAPLLASWKAEPVAPVATPVAISGSLSLPRVYVHTTADRVVSPSLQQRMLARTECVVRTMDTGHLPMLARANEFVQILVEEVS